ncbi:hypothetical protein [Synechococcus elongatus]|uniref:hypothetical protein n=1 Tax=Synechococcus elongatus TaxID=32046 RepID=UPI000F7D927A|nr:hypothetical protein [Synechococcus elongatus]
MQNQPGFQQVYSQNRANGCYVIEIALDQYSDIFNEWDPAPFKRRDLDPYLQQYLEESSDEIPLRYPLEICFQLPQKSRDRPLEKTVCDGFQNCLAFRLYLLSQEQQRLNRYILLFVLAGFSLIGSATLFRDRLGETILISTLVEGVVVSGWVFLWEAVSLIIFKKRELRHRYRSYQRLQQAPIIFAELPPDA